MTSTFAEYLKHVSEIDKEVLNWMYADIISEAISPGVGNLDKKEFNKFLRKNKNSKTVYYDFIHDTVYGKNFITTYTSWLNERRPINGVINPEGKSMDINTYCSIEDIPMPGRITDCGKFSIYCDKSTNVDVRHWWPDICQSICITAYEPAQVTISLSQIHKTVKSCEKIVLRGKNLKIRGGLLGLFQIKGLKDFDCGIDPPSGSQSLSNPHYNLGGIISHHLKNEHGIFDCQADLIESGFEEQAKL